MFKIGIIQSSAGTIAPPPPPPPPPPPEDNVTIKQVDWTVVNRADQPPPSIRYDYSTQKITDISVPVELTVVYDTSAGTNTGLNYLDLYYLITQGSLPVLNGALSPTEQGFTYLASGDIITVNNSDFLSFGVQPGLDIDVLGVNYYFTTASVINNTDKYALVDTFILGLNYQ